MSLIIPANTLASGGFAVDNSCRFDGSSSKLVKAQSAGNRDLWTYSVWIKWSAITTTTTTFFASSDGSNLYAYMGIQSYKIRFLDYNSGNQTNLITNRLFRDPSAWYHIVLAYDSAQGTDSNRVKLYVNGVQETSFSTETYPSSGLDSAVNVNSSNFIISSNQDQSSGSTWNGYMAESCFVDGQALDPTSFGEFDEDSGIFKPIDVSGLTFGTNGFYLDFEDSANLGNDANGGTDFTESGLAAIDQTTDTPTNNFATFNPLDKLTTGAPTGSEGNLKLTGDASTNNTWNSTIGLSSGKWYVEIKTLQSSPDNSIGFRSQTNTSGSLNNLYGFGTDADIKILNGTNSGSAIGSTSQNDILGMALDLDNGKMFIHRNGTYLSSGDPSTGDNPFIVTADGMPTEGVIGGHVYNGVVEVNFGNPPFTISSGNTDGNGYGNFEYAVPSGYLSLCTANLSEVLG